MPDNRIIASDTEQVADGMIQLILKNAGARTLLTSDALAGSTTLVVDNTFHFKNSQQIALMDINEGHVEWHSILQIQDIHNLRIVNPLATDYRVVDQATMQLAIGNVPLSSDAVLFGDREVIPNPELTITVDPTTLNSVEWLYLRGGLSMQHNLVITAYVKLDTNDNATRVTTKYGKYLFDLLVNNLHLDIVNDEVFILQDVLSGSSNIYVPTLDGWAVDTDMDSRRYEVQDYNAAENDFRISQLVDDPTDALGRYHLVLERPVTQNYRVADRAIFRRRTRYLYNSLATEVEYGYIQKGSSMYKAVKVNWWGKEVSEIMFPQVTAGGIQ